MKTSECRSCGAEIIWAESVTGKPIPLDAEPLCRMSPPRGAFRLVADPPLIEPPDFEKPPRALTAQEEPLYRSHFATCPQADEWRK